MADEQTITLAVEGMSCDHCVGAVRKRLMDLPGVKSVDVSLDPGRAVVKGDGIDAEVMIRELDAIGYQAEVKS